MRPAMKMVHSVDPKKTILDQIGDISEFKLFANQVLIGLYIRPEKTASGLFLSDQTRKEDEYQGKAGLVLKLGPQAFVDSDSYSFNGQKAAVGEWVAAWVSDGKQIVINKCLCRVVKDTEIRLVVPEPDMVY